MKPRWPIRFALLVAVLGPSSPTGAQSVESPPSLAQTTPAERQVLQNMIDSSSWVHRAVAAMRLNRYDDQESVNLLTRLVHDSSWQVRNYAILSLARRGVPAGEDWFSTEQEPRVVRTALRCRYTISPARLARGVRVLARSKILEENMLAAEIGAASGNQELVELARETARKIILRMGRIEAGSLSPRLAAITGQPDMRKHYRWQKWVMQEGRRFEVQPAFSVGEHPQSETPSKLASLPADRFAALEDYMSQLKNRKLDLAICLDCTASMSGEIAEAQGGIDDMMLFISDIVGDLRIAIVGYRDRRDKFKTKAWDFTTDVEQARGQLWQLSADGGGDSPEAVHDALKLAYQKLTWRPDSTKTLVLIGDAPPHVGMGAKSIDMARRAYEAAELATHVIQADGKDVKHFPEIAEAGHGRSVNLEEGDSLIAEITGLTLGDTFEEEFREFFHVYLTLCR